MGEDTHTPILLFENTVIGLAVAEPVTGRFLAVNSRMAAIVGYSTEELLQRCIADITHPEDRSLDDQLSPG